MEILFAGEECFHEAYFICVNIFYIFRAYTVKTSTCIYLFSGVKCDRDLCPGGRRNRKPYRKEAETVLVGDSVCFFEWLEYDQQAAYRQRKRNRLLEWDPAACRYMEERDVTKEQHDMIRDAFYQYAERLAQHAMRYVWDRGTVDQLIQDTFEVACRKPEEFCTHEKPLAWLFSVLNNKIRQEWSRAARQEEEYNDEQDYGTAPAPEPLDHILPAGLDSEERELLILRYEKKWSFAQIAERKGIREDACRQKLKRAKDKCGKLLKRSKDEPKNF